MFSPPQGGIFVMSLLLTECNVRSAVIVTGTVVLIVVDVLGTMGWIGVSLNNISLVNIFMVKRTLAIIQPAVSVFSQFLGHWHIC